MSIDPNNHVPPVSPGDDWGDAEGFEPDGGPSVAALPPRRSAQDRPPGAANPAHQVGLRIESTVTREESMDCTARLEVHEYQSEVVKLDQPLDAPPKMVALFKFHERPKRDKGNPLRGEGRDWGERHRFSIRWIIGIGLGVTGVVVLSIAMLPSINASNASRPSRNETRLVIDDAEPVAAIPDLDFLAKQHSAALAICRACLQASQAGEVMPWIRDSQALAEVVSKQWQAAGFSEEKLSQLTPDNSTWEVVELGGKAYGLVRLEFPDSTRFTGYFTREGEELRMDWKATFAYGTATFDELVMGKGDAREIRGSISRADFYSSLWPENEYQCYRFQSPYDGRMVWIYARRDTPVASLLVSSLGSGEITGDSQAAQKITLQLDRGGDESPPNQWLIREVLQVDWATP
jgi:hypothetical protein